MTIATNLNALAGTRRALAARGQPVIVRMVSGVAPNVATFDARVSAIVTDYVAKAPVETMRPEGEITLGARNIIVLADDLAAANIPRPLQKNDKVIVNPLPAQLGAGTANGDQELNILSVDPFKRGVAGAVDIVAMGAQ